MSEGTGARTSENLTSGTTGSSRSLHELGQGQSQVPSQNKICNINVAWSILGVIVLVIIFVSIFCTCTDTGRNMFDNVKSRFKNIKIGSNASGSELKDLDVVMFINPGCPWCMKMVSVIEGSNEKGNIEIVDLSKAEGVSAAKQYGIEGNAVPYFISRKNKTSTKGFKETIKELVDDLAVKPKEEFSTDKVKELNIVLFAREGCGWCTKALEACRAAGVDDIIQVVDVNSPDGDAIVKNELPNEFHGAVPMWKSMTTGKVVPGYRDIEVVVQELS